ncbi:fused MFS/spermidine synthase [candidate division CSSED10-310 bacterium]|uniref:Fused MFS/spermidine synthase n=1 Tax=candidate division CSSED10-310 bacterium TaxID=2855610 RepID=A0ABV6YYQ7_UNCC1
MRDNASRLVPFLFIFSGMSSLILEIVWTKQMILTFGMTAAGVATVLTAFMAGLSLGSYVLGKFGNRFKNPLTVYGKLELIIGVYALLLPWFFDFITQFFIYLVQGEQYSFFVQSIIRFILSFSVLIIPTTLMGGTLPVLSAYYIRSEEKFGKSLGLLYSANTSGAVLGTLISGFLLLEYLGSFKTTIFAACFNFIICGAAYVISYHERVSGARGRLEKTRRVEQGPQSERAHSRSLSPTQKAVLICAFLSGFAALSLEVIWARMLVLSIGSSTYAFTTILVSFLIGIAGGSYVISKWVDRFRQPLLALAGLQIGIGILSLLLLPLFEFLPIILDVLKILHNYEWLPFTLTAFAISFLVLLGPTLFMGATFPLVGRFVAVGNVDQSAGIGLVYSTNTIGSIFGSFTGGFLLIPLVGVKYAVFITVLANFLASFIMILSDKQRSWKSYLLLSGLVIFMAVNFTIVGKWDALLHRGLMGIQGAEIRSTVDQAQKALVEREVQTLYVKEGIQSTVAVIKDLTSDIMALKIDGKTVASSHYQDMRVQKMLGHLPMLLAKKGQKALVVGLGTGMTFGALGLYPQLQTTCIELEAAVIGAAEYFSEYNNAAVSPKPHTKIVIDDGRNYILKLSGTVDIITMDPIHPWVAGAASLFSRDHFMVCLDKLSPGGIMCLWAPLYQLDPVDYKTMVRSFVDVFPHSQIWYTNTDAILIGSNRPIHVDVARIQNILQNEIIRQDLAQVNLDSLESILISYWANRTELLKFVGNVPLNDDDLPILEYNVPRHRFKKTIHTSLYILNQIRSPQYKNIELLTANQIEKLNTLYQSEGLAIKGKILFFAGNHLPAKKYFKQAIDLSPSQSDYKYFLGASCNRLGKDAAAAGKPEAAILDFEEAVSYLPDDLDVHYNLGVAYNNAGRFKKELRENIWLVQHQPLLSAGHLALADTYVRFDMFSEALRHYEKAVYLNPSLKTAELATRMKTLEQRLLKKIGIPGL